MQLFQRGEGDWDVHLTKIQMLNLVMHYKFIRNMQRGRTHESMITMLEPLLIFLRYVIFKAAISASTFFAFLTRPFNLLGNSSKLKH